MQDLQATLEKFAIHTTEKTRLSDVDADGYVKHAIISDFLGSGRDYLFNLWNSKAECEELLLVLVSESINFIEHIRYPDSVVIGTNISEFGHSSLIIEQAIFNNGKCSILSKSTFVNLDVLIRKPKTITQMQRELAREYMV